MRGFSLNLAQKADMDTDTYIHTHTRTSAMLYPFRNKLREGIKKILPFDVICVNFSTIATTSVYIFYKYWWIKRLTYMFSAGGLHDFWQSDTHSLPLVSSVRVQTFLQDWNDFWKNSFS